MLTNLGAMIIEMFKKRVWPFARVILSGFVALLILSIFSLVYCFTGIHISNESGSTDYRWEPGQIKANMFEGFAWLRMDNNGFNNGQALDNAVGDLDILIIGSSHMEATEVDRELNTGSQLAQLLSDYSVYNIGMSGHDIYRCAKNLHDAVIEYDPRCYVIIETDTIEIAEAEAMLVINDGLETITSYDSGLLYMLQKYIPATKNIYKQIVDWNNSEKIRDIESNKPEGVTDEHLLSFLQKMVSDCGNDRQLIILYHPPTHIDKNGELVFDEDVVSVKRFAKSCEAANIIFVDMTDDFAELYTEEHTQAHGFINTAIGVGHLNEYGHKAIAEKLATVIQEEQK